MVPNRATHHVLAAKFGDNSFCRCRRFKKIEEKVYYTKKSETGKIHFVELILISVLSQISAKEILISILILLKAAFFLKCSLWTRYFIKKNLYANIHGDIIPPSPCFHTFTCWWTFLSPKLKYPLNWVPPYVVCLIS